MHDEHEGVPEGQNTEFNYHSLYSYYSARTTATWFFKQGKRPFLIPRSTFAGSGKWGGTWLGENHSQYRDLASSVPGVLSMNVFGIPLVGADVCGNIGNTTDDLCTKWYNLAAVAYPFSRNQNGPNSKEQAPFNFGAETK